MSTGQGIGLEKHETSRVALLFAACQGGFLSPQRACLKRYAKHWQYSVHECNGHHTIKKYLKMLWPTYLGTEYVFYSTMPLCVDCICVGYIWQDIVYQLCKYILYIYTLKWNYIQIKCYTKIVLVDPTSLLVTSQQHAWFLPLLFPSGPLRTVHSSMTPYGSKRRYTSSSVCCLFSIPTNSFLSSETNKGRNKG